MNNLYAQADSILQLSAFVTSADETAPASLSAPTGASLLAPLVQQADTDGPSRARHKLELRLRENLERNLPQLLEFQRLGYNILFPDTVNLEALLLKADSLQCQLVKRSSRALLKRFDGPLEGFVHAFVLFREAHAEVSDNLPDARAKIIGEEVGVSEHPGHGQLIKQASRVAEGLRRTFELVQSIDGHPTFYAWDDVLSHTRGALRDDIFRTVPLDPDGNYVKGQIRGNLSNDNPENIKLNLLVNSLTSAEKTTREALSRTLTGEARSILLELEVIWRSVSTLSGTPELALFAARILNVCMPLQTVLETVLNYARQINPGGILNSEFRLPEKTFRGKLKALPGATLSALGTVAGEALNKGRDAKAIYQVLSAKTAKSRQRAAFGLPTLPDRITGKSTGKLTGKALDVVKDVGMLLLGRIQQTRTRLASVEQAARPVQQAVEQARTLARNVSRGGIHKLLDDRLHAESVRWQREADQGKERLEQTLDSAMDLDTRALLSTFGEMFLRVPTDVNSRPLLHLFQRLILTITKGVGAVESEVKQRTVEYCEAGEQHHNGLRQAMQSWQRTLSSLQGDLKTSHTQATGRSIDNFSHSGMLARGMAEQVNVDKQAYLQDLSAPERPAAEVEYDRVFLEILEDYLPLLSKDSDPTGADLLRRLRIEIGHAGQGSTLYPATMAELLAGMKSKEQAIRDWSRRKVVCSTLMAAFLPVKVGFKLVSATVRPLVKFSITGVRVAMAARKARRGVHVGQGDVEDQIKAYASDSFIKAGIKVVISFPPLLAEILGLATIAVDVYEGGPAAAAKQIVEDLFSTSLFLGPSVGTTEGLRAYMLAANARRFAELEAAIEQAMSETLTQSGPEDEIGVADARTEEVETFEWLSAEDELARMAASPDPQLAGLAARLNHHPGRIDLSIQQSSFGRPSFYRGSTHTITLGAQATDWDTLHEIIHGLSARQFRYGWEHPDSRLGKIVRQIDSVRLEVLAIYQGDDPLTLYYLSSPEEFVAGLYSGHGDFIEHLRQQDWLSIIIEWLCQLIGLPATESDALTRAMRLSDALMRAPLGARIEEPDDGSFENDDWFGEPSSERPTRWKKVGKLGFTEWTLYPGLYVQLTFHYPNGGTWKVLIEVPDDQRGWPAWRDYVATYLNTVTPLKQPPWRNPVRVGEEVSGDNQPTPSNSADTLYVLETSTSCKVTQAFVNLPPAESRGALIKASDRVSEEASVTTPLPAEVLEEQVLAPVAEPAEELVPAPVETVYTLIGRRRIGDIDDANMDFPSGKKLYLNFVKRSGERFSVIIEIPASECKNGDWQEYAAHYVNTHNVERGNVKAGAGLGVEQVGYSAYDDKTPTAIYTTGSSDIASVTWGMGAPAKLAGTNLSFALADRYSRELDRFAALELEQQRLEANIELLTEREVTDHLVARIARLRKRLQRIAVDKALAQEWVDKLSQPVLHDWMLIWNLSAAPETITPSGHPAIDADAQASVDKKNLSRKLVALRAYRQSIKDHRGLYSDAEHAARQQQLDELDRPLYAKMAAVELKLEALFTAAEAAKENLSIKERNQLRVQRRSALAQRLFDLQTRLNRLQNNLRMTWDKDNLTKPKLNRGHSAPVRPTGRYQSSDFRKTSNGHRYLAERDGIEADIKRIDSELSNLERDDPLETSLTVKVERTGDEPVDVTSGAEPEYGRRVAAIKDDMDGWMIRGADARGIDIKQEDLDKKYIVSYAATAGASPEPKIRVRRTFTLREILLGEADRYDSVNQIIMDIEPAPRAPGGRQAPAQLWLTKLLIRRDRLGIAEDVAFEVDKAIDEILQSPYVINTFKAQWVGALYSTLTDKDNLAVIAAGQPIYQQLVNAYLLGYLQPCAVYVEGKALAGVIAVGRGDFRILVSVQTGKVLLFDATTANPALADFLKVHVADLDKDSIKAESLAPQKHRGLGNEAIWPSANITFGRQNDSVYDTLLEAAIARLKSNLGGLVYTRDEADDDRQRGVKQAGLTLMMAILTIATQGRAAKTQFWSALWGAAVSSTANVQIEGANADNADRLSDKLESQRDVKIGKLLIGLKMIVPNLSRIKLSTTASELLGALGDPFVDVAELAIKPIPVPSLAPIIPAEFSVDSNTDNVLPVETSSSSPAREL